MTDLAIQLDRLGLSQYLESFISEGFDTWETVLDITEFDLNYLNVKLGHRRKLQRAIAEARGQPPDKALVTDVRKASNVDRSDDSGTEPKESIPAGSSQSAGPSGSGQKRKYRRHPKLDPKAPTRPPSAYVIFSNQVREDLKGQDLSFTEIAKVVGERWQVLPPELKEACEQQANLAKEKYNVELGGYKKTAEYLNYQEYLLEFKAKYGHSRTEGKRSKLETETSATLPGASPQFEGLDRQTGSRSTPAMSVPRSSRSSPPSAGGLHAGFQRPPSSESPALYSDTVNSPARGDPYSPDSRSPALSATMTFKEHRASQLQSGHEGRSREQSYHAAVTLPPVQTSFQAGYPPTYEQWPEPGPGQPYVLSNLPRRTSRSEDPTPPLTRNDSTKSSVDSVSSLHLPASALAPDSNMPTRTLPQPVRSGSGPRGLPMDLRSPVGVTASMTSFPHTQAGPELQRSSNLPALLRAIEIAKEQSSRAPDS